MKRVIGSSAMLIASRMANHEFHVTYRCTLRFIKSITKYMKTYLKLCHILNNPVYIPLWRAGIDISKPKKVCRNNVVCAYIYFFYTKINHQHWWYKGQNSIIFFLTYIRQYSSIRRRLFKVRFLTVFVSLDTVNTRSIHSKDRQ